MVKFVESLKQVPANSDTKLKYTKFYYTLALSEIMNEEVLYDVALKYKIYY